MDGGKKLATMALNATGQASFATSTVAIGKHSITAVYKGSTNDNASTSPVLVQTVDSFAQAQRAARKRRARLRASRKSVSFQSHTTKFRTNQS
jgi:hypothetical protein